MPQTLALDALHIEVADLPGRPLGQFEGGLPSLDTDAAGWGWFVDATREGSSEFAAGADALLSTGGPAAGRRDQLSRLTHELGYSLWLGHVEVGLMAESLQPGPQLLFGLPGSHRGGGGHAADAAGSGMTIDWASTRGPAGQPVLDVEALAFRALVMPPAAGLATAGQAGWQQRFVNHLGANAERLQPNASLRLHLPVASEVGAKLSRL